MLTMGNISTQPYVTCVTSKAKTNEFISLTECIMKEDPKEVPTPIALATATPRPLMVVGNISRHI